jgi:O-antigen/teichoic acid export membrane protein
VCVAVVATWATAILQAAALHRKLRSKIEPGPKAFAFREWVSISFPVFLVTCFYYILTFMDVLVLQAFRPPNEVAVYFAATKVIAMVAFIYFSVTVAVAHRFAQYNAAGDRNAMAAFVAESIRWTFWPSLAATAAILALGKPILALFGPEYVQGYPLLAILAIGHLARAAVGPVERLLNMLGQQNICALVYAGACALNLIACLVLIPRFGIAGAAIALSLTLSVESAALFWIVKSRLGFHPFIWGRAQAKV